MTDFGRLVLVRHGETEWSAAGKHTSFTEVPLTEVGEDQARLVGEKLAGLDGFQFARVLSSPRNRAFRTASLAGFANAEVDDNLAEWNYGEYEGMTTPEIRQTVPGWTVWSDPCPGGETSDEVARRADRVIGRVNAVGRNWEGDTLVFGHGHSLRVLAARWLYLPPADGRLLALDTATISVLGYERDAPVVLRWNA